MTNTNFLAHTSLKLSGLACMACIAVMTSVAGAQDFKSSWANQPEQRWIGSEYWANRLQDWEIRRNRLECVSGAANKPIRTVHLLTYRLGDQDGDATMAVRTGLIDKANRYEGAAHNAATGFLIEAGGSEMNYLAASLIHHNPGPGGGYFAGIDGSGKVFIRDFESPLSFGEKAPPGAMLPPDRKTAIYRGILNDITLILDISFKQGKYYLVLTVRDTKTQKQIGQAEKILYKGKLAGNIALVSHPGGEQKSDRYWFRDWDPKRRAFEKWAGATARFWFKDWKISGAKLEVDKKRSMGPILSTKYTLHHNTLTLTAQLFPITVSKNKAVELELQKGGKWKSIAKTKIVVPGYTASFRINKWKEPQDIPYRVTYAEDKARGNNKIYYWSGIIRKNPVDINPLVAAAFTGSMMVRGGYEYPLPYGVDGPFDARVEGKPVKKSNTFLWNTRVYYPHAEVVKHVGKQQPDLLFFSGDQVYEGNPTRAVEKPLEEAHLDYLYKWYLWCITWRDLTKDIPTVCMPDDHDVYQRNIWGDHGRVSPEGDLDGSYGGYFMDPKWINMVQRTQTAHLPPPAHPKPVKNGIGVYYTSLVMGGVGFAIIEDRKFKSFPSIVKAEMSRDSHITQKEYDISKADASGATLLGEGQLKFLEEFAANWKGHSMKAVLSQTIFANLQILNPRKDGVPQKIDTPLDRDLDANGWPQTGRRKALQAMRKGFMLHIAGDQHLASVIHHGTDEWEDAGWSFCVPSVANYYARSWNPKFPPVDSVKGTVPYTGRYEDGFKNKLTVKAVANPTRNPRPGQFPKPLELYSEAPGYGIIKFDKAKRAVTLECWPRHVDPTDSSTGTMYKGWPITLKQEDNYAREAKASLPLLKVAGLHNPAVKVINEADGQALYTIRIQGTEYQPGVFELGNYTVEVKHPESGKAKTFKNLPAERENKKTIEVKF